MSRLGIGVASALVAVACLALPALAAAKPPVGKDRIAEHGTLHQLRGEAGCLVDRSKAADGCGTARALQGPGPLMGSHAVAVSPDGRNVYVAASKSDAIAVFSRDRRSGALTQPAGAEGCVAAKGAAGCGVAIGLDGPNSVAISPDGRFVYATSRTANSVTTFHRNKKTGALRQLPPGSGCVSGVPIPGCASGRALVAPDVLVVSPDGENLYVGSFFGNAVASFQRAKNGALFQLPEVSGCIAEAIAGCAPGIAFGGTEGMAISPDGTSVYVANGLANTVVTLSRDAANGALTQPAGGCIVDAALTGCTTGVRLKAANAVAIAPAGRDVYVAADSGITSFGRAASGVISQKPGTHACMVNLRAVGCSFGRAMAAPEGIAVSPAGTNVYVASFSDGAIDVLDRERESGVLAQKPGAAGCLAARLPGCTPARALAGVSSVAVSPDGRNVYATAFGSNAVDVFRRVR